MTERLATHPVAPEAPTPEVSTTAERPPISRRAEYLNRLRVTVERVSVILERRAINKLHGQALRENEQFDRETQDAAYADYAENIAATAKREAEEHAAEQNALNDRYDAMQALAKEERSKERQLGVKKFFGKITHSVFVSLESQGFIQLRSSLHKRRHSTIGWYLRRKQAAEERQAERDKVADGFLTAEQAATVRGETPDPDEVDDTDAPDAPELPAAPTSETPDDSPETEGGILNRARERAKAALERRRSRREHRPTSEHSRSLTERARGAFTKVGRGALRFFKRTRAAAGAAVGAIAGARRGSGS